MNLAWNLPQDISFPLSVIIALALAGMVILWVTRCRRAGTCHRRNAEAVEVGTQPFERSFDLLLDARWQEAADVLSAALRVDPTRIPEYLELGKLFRRQGELARAARMFEQLLARPELGKAARIMTQHELALAYHALGWHAAAAPVLEQILGVDPSHAEARRTLRKLHEELGQWDTAAALEMLRLQRGETTDRRVLAALLTQQGKVSGAVGNMTESAAHLRSALTLDPNGIEAPLYLGRLYLRQGHVQEAFHIWDGLAKRRPEFLFLAFRDIQAAFRQRQNDRGWESFLRAFTEQHPDDPAGHLALAEWYEARGQVDEARHGLLRVLELDPTCREAHMALLSLYRAQGIPAEALNTYAQLAGGSPHMYAERFRCLACGYPRDEPFGKCPSCHGWGTPERRLPSASGRPILTGEITPPLEPSRPGLFTPLAMSQEPPLNVSADV